MLRIFLITAFILLFGYNAHAQLYQPKRIDIKVQKNWYRFETIVCGENGVLTFYFKSRRKLFKGKEKKLYISQYDHNLNKIREDSIELNTDLLLRDYTYDKKSEKLYILFANRLVVSSSNSNKNNPIEIVTVNASSGKNSNDEFIKLAKHSIALGSYASYKKMQATNGQVFMFIQRYPMSFLNICFEPLEGIKLFLGSASKNHVFVLDSKKNHNNKSIAIKHNGKYHQYKNTFIDNQGNVKYLSSIVDDKKTGQEKLKLLTLDKVNGTIISSITMNDGVRTPLQYSRALEHTNNELIFIAMAGEDKNTKKSEILFRYFKGDKMEFEQRFSLKKITGEDNRQKILGLFNTKDQTNMRFHSKSYKLDNKGNYIIIGERLSPFYKTYYHTDANGNIQSDRVHIGWTYHEAYLMAFNKNHELIWTNQFDMENTTFEELRFIPRLTAKRVSDHKLILMFGMKDKITNLVIERAEVIGEQESFTLKSQFKKSRIREDYLPTIEYWYNYYFIASGYINVKKSGSILSGKDKIYFVTKLMYDR